MTTTRKKLLLLLDMNGTVCFRSEFPVDGARPDLYVRRKHYYKRQGVESFVQRLSAKFDIAVYSSMMAHNLEAGVDAIMPRERKLLTAILDRTMNKPDPDGENEWDTVRDMKKVPRPQPEIAVAVPVWKFLNWHGPTSTILLDNEARKFRDEPRNGIVVPEYGPAEVRMRVVDTLASLEEYLLRLAEAAPADVRTYMEANPPALASWGRPVPENPIRLVAPAAPPPPLAAASTAPLQPKRLAAEGTSGSDTPAVAGAKEEEEGRTTVAADSLGELMSSLKIESKEPKAGPAASISEPSTAFAAAAKAPKEETQVDFSELALSAAAAAVGSSEEQQRLAEDAVPRGTALHLLCIKEGDFIVRNTKFGLTVRGPASSGIRVDAKMDFHRLVEEAAAIGGVRLKVAVNNPGGGGAGMMRLFDFIATNPS